VGCDVRGDGAARAESTEQGGEAESLKRSMLSSRARGDKDALIRYELCAAKREQRLPKTKEEDSKGKGSEAIPYKPDEATVEKRPGQANRLINVGRNQNNTRKREGKYVDQGTKKKAAKVKMRRL